MKKRSKLGSGLCLAAIVGTVAVTLDYLSGAAAVQAQAVRSGNQAMAVSDLESAISQTAAVVEGWVTDIKYDYSDEEGPWTRVTISDVHAHFGTAPASLELRQFGGPLPDGRMIVAAELPVFVVGKQYIVFLRNTAWNVSPVVGDLAYRVETVDRSEVLVNSDGLAVTSVDRQGVGIGPALFEGPDRAGTSSKALVSSLQGLESRPLDRQRFVAALGETLGARRLSVAGTFGDRPAGQFKWRGQQTARSADQTASTNAAAATVGGSSVEVDTPPQSR